MNPLTLYNQTFSGRLLLGTAAYPTTEILRRSVAAAEPAMITVSLRRQSAAGHAHGQGFWDLLQAMQVPILPNTAGCQSVQEAVATAHMARAFALAVASGRLAHQACPVPPREQAQASTPTVGQPFWHSAEY